jgi:putative Holliday junction resolvase
MGLDIGDVRIGVAVSDLLMLTAQGVETYTRSREEQDIEHICDMAKQYGVGTIVCGMPKNMDGSKGEQAKKVEEFAEKLRRHSGLPLIYWDERLTTKAAQRTLLEGI